MKNSSGGGAHRIFANPAVILIFNILLAIIFLSKETRNSLEPIFGQHFVEVILLTELMSFFALAIKMRMTGKFLYRLLNSFSIKTLLVAFLSAVLLFGMIDEVFIFFILALIFIIVDLFAVEAEEFYYKGNFIIIIFLFAAAVFSYTGSAAIMLLFLAQYGLNSTRKSIEPYDWLLLSFYFATPITFYSAGTLAPISFWIGFYFLFKSFTILAGIFGLRIFDLGERARKMLSLKSEKEKYFWSEKEEGIFAGIVIAPIFLKIFLKADLAKFMPLWLALFFIFMAGSLFFINPEWRKKYYGRGRRS